MGIDRAKIAGQLESLRAQRQGHENDIHAIDGCIQLCQAWLTELDAEEQETSAVKEEKPESISQNTHPCVAAAAGD